MTLAALTLLHVLIFVYWLGGDLGAFYASTILTDTKQSTAARLTAAKVLNNVDMAPRTALILAAPTGLSLAVEKSWLPIPAPLLIAIWIVALLWLALAWNIHLKHRAPTDPLRRLDLYLRPVIALFLTLTAIAGFSGRLNLPLFLSLKLLLLAVAIAAGLLIRGMLKPIGPAFAKLANDGASPETDQAIGATLNRARPVVISLWALLLLAAFLGLWTPT